ncbi:MAG: hypothetical protein GX661_02555 [Acholeplasmataceae bacterium]|nr:hypothetical protein [Acholeplasmataceae bacterium]
MNTEKRKNMTRVLVILGLGLFVIVIAGCIQENCGTGKMYDTSANDSLSILVNTDTLRLFLIGSTEYFDKLIKYEIENDDLLGDTIKANFFMTGEHRQPGTHPTKNYEWNTDTLKVWFTFYDDSTQNGDCNSGQVLAKTNCSPIPNNIDIDSVYLLKSNLKEIEIIQDWNEVKDPDNPR